MKWQLWNICDGTWGPAQLIPQCVIQEFQHPCPSAERINDAKEQLALALERGLKTGLQYTESLELKHELVRAIFPRMPSDISRRPYAATKKDLMQDLRTTLKEL